jgi:PAS domain S-box-containing protein
MLPPPIRTLAGKWLLAAFLLLAAGIGALWYSALSAYETAVLRERGRELQAIAELKIEFIRFWVAERRSDSVVQADRRLMARALAPDTGRPGSNGTSEVLGQLEAIRQAYNYEAVMLQDLEGNIRLGAGASETIDYAGTGGAAADAIKNGRTVFSRTYHATSGNGKHTDIGIATPVIDKEQPGSPIVGALVFHLDPREHLDPFLRQWPAPSESGETFLVERTNGALTYLSSLRHAEPESVHKEVSEPTLPAAVAARGEHGVIEGIDYRGVPVLAAVGQVPGMPWYVVAKLDRTEVLAPVRREALWSGALSALLVLALGLAMLSWQRRGQSELALAQQAATQAALSASEARFRKLIENAWDLLVLFDRDMRIAYASPSVDQQVGGKMLGESIARGTALVHPEDVGHVEGMRLKALAHPGAPQRFEHRLKGRYDHWMRIEASFTNHFDDPDIGALTYIGRDITERKWAEQALRDSEERYRFLFKLSPDAVFLHRNGVVFETNDAALRLFRAGSENTLIGRHWRELVAPEDWPSVEQRIVMLESGEQAYLQPSEQRYRSLDGQAIEVEATGARIVVDGTPAIMSVVRDISGRKRAEVELKESEARFRTVFENAPVGLVQAGEDGQISMPNPAMCAMLGYTREELAGKNFRDITWPEDLQANLDVRQRLFAGEIERFELRKRYMRKDGSILWGDLIVGALPDADGNVTNSVAIVRDISAQIAAEKALHESENTLRIFLDTIPGVAMVADTEGRVIFANRMAAASLGIPLEAITGSIVFSHFPPDVAETRRGWHEKALRERRYFRFEDRRDNRDFEIHVCPVVSESEEIHRVAVIAFDISERKQDEAKRLELARQQRDTLVREVHHRIKNHLQGLAGLLRQHMAHQALRPVLEEVVAQINAISIVHGLQGREKGDTSLRNLAAEIAAFLGSITGSRIDLDCPPHGCLWAVAEAEAVPLALVLNELLTNALRHGTDKAQVSLSLECDGSRARLIIRNPGCLDAGVDFARGRGFGTGLGLIRSLLPQQGVILELENAEESWVEARLELGPPVLLPMGQVVSLR